MDTPPPKDLADRIACLTLLVALATTVGSFALTLAAGFFPCPLCFYQRTFAMALLAIYAVGCVSGVRGGTLAALGVAPVVGGLGVAIQHVRLEATGILDCPVGLLGLGTSPQQSLAAFVLLAGLVGAGAFAGKVRAPAAGLGVLLGGVFAWLSCISNAPMPAAKPPTLDEHGVRILKICERHWTPPADAPAPPPAPGPK